MQDPSNVPPAQDSSNGRTAIETGPGGSFVPGIGRLLAHAFFLAALGALAVLLFAPARFPLERVREALPYPFQLDAEEGFILGQAMRFAVGLELYPPIDEPPYLVDNYPPIYPVLWSFFADPEAPSLRGGRWISAVSAGAAAFAIAFIILFQGLVAGRGISMTPSTAGRMPAPQETGGPQALRSGETVLIAWCCPIFFLTSYALLRWSAYARVDLLAVAFALWGLAVFGIWGERSRWARATAVVLFALALMTKQVVIAAPLSCFLWMLGRNRRAAIWFALWMFLAAALPALVLCALTRGRYWSHTVAYNQNAMYWSEVWRIWLPHVWRLYHWLVLAAAALVVWEAWNRGRRISLWLIYFGLNALSLVSLAKAGSAENYLLEPQAALSLFIGTGLSQLLRCAGENGRLRRSAAWIAAAVVLALLFLHAGFLRLFEPVLYRAAPRPSLEALQKGKQVVRLIRERGGPVLSEDPIYAFLGGRPAEFQNFIMTQLTAEKKWDEGPFIERVERRAFSLVVTHQDIGNEEQVFNRYSPALRRALRENYTLIATLPRPRPLQTIFIYAPRQDSVTK